MSVMFFLMLAGVMPCSTLNACCFWRRRALRDPDHRRSKCDGTCEREPDDVTIVHEEPPEFGGDATPTRWRRGTGPGSPLP